MLRAVALENSVSAVQCDGLGNYPAFGAIVIMEKIKLHEIASRIDAHLKRLEADKNWNSLNEKKLSKLWNSGAVASGNRVFCVYVSYQGQSSLTRQRAIDYLARLDAGFKGRHFESESEQSRLTIEKG